MMSMKRYVKAIVSACALIAARMILLFKFPQGKVQRADDSQVEDLGYTLKPLWRELPNLSPSTIDVSIVVPCYNAEKYVGRLLDSALNQRTHYSYEVIAVDDGSTDGTLGVLNDYASRFPGLVVCHQDNSGVSMARNRGIELARGGYIGFADSDDYLEPDFIEVLYTKAKLHDADMVQSSYCVITPEGRRRNYSTPDLVMGINDMEARRRTVSGYVWLSLYRKSCFERVRFPERFWYEDMINKMVFERILDKIVTVSDILYTKYARNDSEAVHWTKRVDDRRKIDQYWLAKSFIEFTTNDLGLPMNDTQYRQLLYELGPMMLGRTKGLEDKRRKTVFQLAGTYLGELQYECTGLGCTEKVVEESLVKRSFPAWVMASIAERLQQ